MPLIVPDDDWTVGWVRVRASTLDPFEGLRGHAYIAARGLNKPVERLDAGVATERERALLKLVAITPLRMFPRRQIRRPA